MMKCPICGGTASVSFRPFCSERCVLIDLAGWFGESYWIASDEFVDEDEFLEETIESIESVRTGRKRTIH